MSEVEPTAGTPDDIDRNNLHLDPAEFFKTGGTMSGDAASYVPRRADRELLDALNAGEFCYVLTSRQMGKSSLMVRTAVKLRETGASVVLLDLTAFGRNLTSEQWYRSLRDRTGRQLDLEDEMEAYAEQEADVAPLQRWVSAITDLVLKQHPGKLVIFLDEIDFAKSLPFDTDEFFSAIRSCYNRRVLDKDLDRLTFCLLGVASPSDLIRDSRTTPFNIGRRIELTDFTPEEAVPLTQGLRHDPSTASAVLNRVLYWTGGHPYLTQRLCRAVAESHATNEAAVDQLCDELFLSNRARTIDDNLLFAREQMLREDIDRAAILTLYARVRDRKKVPDDPANQLITVLRLSGVVRSDSGHLRITNRIYGQVFDRRWIESNMPDQEKRRQKIAYRRGLLKAGLIASIIVAAMGGLAGWAMVQSHIASTERGNTEVALVNAEGQRKRAEQLKSLSDDQKKAAETAKAEAEEAKRLAETRRKDAEEAKAQSVASVARLEQQTRLAHDMGTAADTNSHSALLQHAQSLVSRGDAFASTGRWADAKQSYDDARAIYSRANMSAVEADLGLTSAFLHSPPPLMRLPTQESAVTCLAFSTDGRYGLSGAANGSITLWDLPTATELFAFEGHTAAVRALAFSPDGHTAVSASSDGTVRTWDTTTGKAIATPLRITPGTAGALLPSFDVCFTKAGGEIVSCDLDGIKLWDLNGAPVGKTNLMSGIGRVRISPDGSSVITMKPNYPPEIQDLTGSGQSRVLNGHYGGASDAGWSQDGHFVVTAGYDQTVRLWDAKTGSLIRIFTGPTAAVRAVAISSDGRRIMAAGDDRSVRAWDADSGREVLALTGHAGAVQACAMSPDGRLAISGGADSGLIVWSISGDAGAPLFRDVTGRNVAISSDGNMVTFDSLNNPNKSGNRNITIYDQSSGFPLFCGDVVSSPQADHRVVLNRADDRTAIGIFSVSQGGEEPAESIVLKIPTTQPVATTAPSGTVKISWFSADGRRGVATGDGQTTATLWDMQVVAPVAAYKGHTNCIMDAAFRPDGAMVATASCDGTVRLWDTQSPREIRTFVRQHPDPGTDEKDANAFKSVRFSPDGNLLFASYEGREAEVWDFSQPARFRDFGPRLDSARTALRHNPQDAAALHTLAEWYESRGVWEWASQLLSRSKSAIDASDSARRTRCAWRAGNSDLALAEAQRVLDAKSTAEGYVRLIRDVVTADRSAPQRFKLHNATTGDQLWLKIDTGTWRESSGGMPQTLYQAAGRLVASGKPGTLFLGSPINDSEHGPDVFGQAFVTDDGSIAEIRADPQGNWTTMGPVTAAVAESLPATAPLPSAVKAPDVGISGLVEAALAAESKGNFVAATKAYQEVTKRALAAEDEDLRLVNEAIAKVKEADQLLNEGNPSGALKILNAAAPRLQNVEIVTSKKVQITDFQTAALRSCELGNVALKASQFAEAFNAFSYASFGGSAEGMLRLGDMFKAGQGTKADETQAKIWWMRAVKAGSAEASSRLAGPRPAPAAAPVIPFNPGRS